jgi:hypothetical protein
MMVRLALAFLLTGVLGLGVLPAAAQDDDEGGWEEGSPEPGAPDDDAPDANDDAPDEADYHEALAPYGGWVNDPTYGSVWHPAVDPGWRPYADGNWVWTSYGWTWVSSGPWAWTFHYGRWTMLPGYGWVWMPGTVWGPAWVDWYESDGYVGWAPLPPFGTHVTVVNQFVFVRSDDFCSHHVRRVFVEHHRLPRDFDRRWRDRRFSGPPAREHIERVSRTPVVHMHGRPPESLPPHERNARVRPAGPHAPRREPGDRPRGRRGDDEVMTAPAAGRQGRPHPVVDPPPGRDPDGPDRGGSRPRGRPHDTAAPVGGAQRGGKPGWKGAAGGGGSGGGGGERGARGGSRQAPQGEERRGHQHGKPGQNQDHPG